MSAALLAASASLIREAPASLPLLRLVDIRGDSLEPLLRRGDFVLAAPVSGWAGEGLYVTSNAFGEDVVHDCAVAGTRAEPRIRLFSHLEVAGRRAYPDQFVTLAEFERTVTGKVLVTCQVRDRDLLHRFAQAT